MRLALAIGIVALLAALAWLLLAEPPAPAGTPAEPRAPRVAAGPAAESLHEEPLTRTVATPVRIVPPGAGELLHITARDPYGVLDAPHRIWVRQGARNTEPDWIRDGENLVTRLEPGSPPPEALLLFLKHPDFPIARARCAPSAREDLQGFASELDLESGVAAVRVTVRGASRMAGEVWTAEVQPPTWFTPLEFRASEQEPCTILAPASGELKIYCGPRSTTSSQRGFPLHAGSYSLVVTVPGDASGN